jgi:hypothetical protein
VAVKKKVYRCLLYDARSGQTLPVRIKAESVERAALLIYLVRDAIEEASRN